MITPRIDYNTGSGTVTLIPTFPPVQKPGADERAAVRHDSITISGIKQSITDRVEKYVTLTFNFVPLADLAVWAPFIDWAIAGGKFRYFPDQNNLSVFNDYTIEDAGWVPKRVAFSMYAFSLRLRQWV